MINDAHVATADVKATNGVIHVIDKVPLPPAAAGATQRRSPARLRRRPALVKGR
jgi:hypothetical protein